MTMDLKIGNILETKRGNRCLIVENVKFSEANVLKNGHIRFRCTTRPCNAHIIVNANLDKIIQTKHFPHNHAALEDSSIKLEIIRTAVKRKGVEDLHSKPKKIISEEIKKEGVENDVQKSYLKRVRKSLYAVRKQHFPTLSKTQEDTYESCSKSQEIFDVVSEGDTNDQLHGVSSGNTYKRGVTNMAKLSEVISTLKKLAPLSLAESWDNVGLLVQPHVQKNINCVFLTNDLTEDVLEEAIGVNANLIVSYHPSIFVPFKRVILDNWKGRLVARCLSQDIAVFSPHTSWDTVENGLTDWLISCFDGTKSSIKPLNVDPEFSHLVTLTSVSNSNSKKISEENIKATLETQTNIEAYKDYIFLNESGPQIQLLCSMNVLLVLNKISKDNNFSVFASKNKPLPSNTTRGAGRYCELKNKVTIKSTIENIKKHLGVNNLMVALARGSTLESTIESVAAVAGSGASQLRGVKADLYLTGEMSHHDVLDAVHNNVTVILANHSNTERKYLSVFAAKLLAEMPQLTVHVSKVDKDPLIFV